MAGFTSLEDLVSHALSGGGAEEQEKVAHQAAPQFDLPAFEKLAAQVSLAMTTSVENPELVAVQAELRRRGIAVPEQEKIASAQVDAAMLLTLPSQMNEAAKHIRALQARLDAFAADAYVRSFAEKLASAQNLALDDALEISRDLHSRGEAAAADTLLTRIGGQGIGLGVVKEAADATQLSAIEQFALFVAEHGASFREQF